MRILVAMRLQMPLHNGVGRRNSNTTADVAQKVKDAARVSNLIFGHGPESHARERDKHHGDPESA